MSLTPLHTLSNDSTAPAVLFAGQGSAWQKAIADAAASPHQGAQLRDILRSSHDHRPSSTHHCVVVPWRL